MLTIRPEQWKEFEKYDTKRFLERMEKHVIEFKPTLADLPPLELHQHLSDALPRARRYGLETEVHVAAFLRACAVLDWEFDLKSDRAWNHLVQLLKGDSASDEKAAALHETVVFAMGTQPSP